MVDGTPTSPREEVSAGRDYAAVIACSAIWGTTWFAITFQIAGAHPVAALVYRFALAAALLFGWCLLRGERLRMAPGQHVAAAGLGGFTFALDYYFVYAGSSRLISAVVAVIFASLTFVTIVVFWLAEGERPSRPALVAAGLGMAGVALLSAEEMRVAHLSGQALIGVGFVLGGVVCAAIGNLFAKRGERLGVSVPVLTSWAMAYGAGGLALFGAVTGVPWAVTPSWPFFLSLLHVALAGSVIAFVVYYGLARRRGYTLASYVAALTPVVAMAVSTLFEDKSWTPLALAGVGAVLLGQWLLMRVRRPS